MYLRKIHDTIIMFTCIRDTFALLCLRVFAKLLSYHVSTCFRETFTLSLKIVTKKLFSWLREVGSGLDKRGVRHLIVQTVSYKCQTLYLWRGYIRELGVIVEWLSLNQKVTIFKKLWDQLNPLCTTRTHSEENQHDRFTDDQQWLSNPVLSSERPVHYRI